MSNKAPSEELREVTTEEAALRRVATLVAQESSPVEIFVAVTEECSRVLECEAAGLLRFEPDETATLIAQSDTPWDPPPLGTRFTLDGDNFVTRVFHTERASRVDDWTDASGSVAGMATHLGVRSAVASPVIVGARLWGTIIAATSQDEPLPADVESRLAQFTELVATAIANAEAREALARLADEQAALRRVATLVADGIGPEGIFPAVAAEVESLFGADVSAIVRFEEEGTATVLGDAGGPHTAGKRVTLDPGYVVDLVRQTSRSARFDTDDPTAADMPSIVRALGIQAAVATPIMVEGKVWGAITAASVDGSLAPGAELRLSEFTELVATAVSNTQAREHAATLSEEQAALRRVATLVAEDAPPEELYFTVALEVGKLLEVHFSGIARLTEGSVIPLAAWAAEGEHPPLPAEWPMQDGDPVTAIAEAGHAVRWDDWTGVEGPIAEFIRSELGVRSTVATPIVVEGRVWGALAVHAKQPLPPDAESRMEQFSALVATAVASTQAHVAVRAAADEQAALRRVATLVAAAAAPSEVFDAVTREIALVLGADATLLCRADPDGAAIVVGTWAEDASAPAVGTRIPRGGTNLITLVLDTGRSARIESYDDGASGDAAEVARSHGLRSAVGAPIVVEGRLWGLVIAGTTGDKPLPPDAEGRLAGFTELVATAIANAEARRALERVADEQAALRRVATLVAVEASQDEIFNAVAEGAAMAVGEELRLVRFEGDHAVVVASSEGPHFGVLPVGTRLPVGGNNAVSGVFRTGEPTRIDDYSEASGPIAEAARLGSPRSSVATPIVVEGHLWGAMLIGTFGEEPVPPGTEGRLGQFAELMATSIANTEARNEIERLADQEAALRRIATLIAQGAAPASIFAAVTKEVATIFDSIAAVQRFDHEGPAVVFVGASQDTEIPIGTRWEFEEGMASAEVYRTERPVRIDWPDWSASSGPVAAAGARLGIVSQVQSPISVNGQLWGTISINAREPLPPDAEQRLEKFTELVTTAIANTEARNEIERLAEQEAALRRIATLVARGVEPEELFEAVAKATAAAFGAIAIVLQFEHDPPAALVVGLSRDIGLALGTRWPLEETLTATEVYRTGRPARLSAFDWGSHGGPLAEAALQAGVSSHVSCPILVEGSLWGLIGLHAAEELPPDTEERLERFTELVTTAIANASGRAELLASRARIVAAGDEARRRIERNLHDGTQQRLLALGLDLQRARLAIPEDQRDTHAALEGVEQDLDGVLADLRELSHGLHPPLLSRLGLGPSLQALARRSPIPVHLEIELPDRPEPAVETAMYYVISEALTNAIKHSQASEITITVSGGGEGLHASIVDDGVGGADPGHGSGLTGLSDRVDALGGSFAFDSPGRGGTRITVQLPLAPTVSR